MQPLQDLVTRQTRVVSQFCFTHGHNRHGADTVETGKRQTTSDVFIDHVVELVNRTRIHPALEVGCSPRAGIALLKSSRARALINGRDYVIPEDMYSLAGDVILHRIRLNYEALADGLTGESVLQNIMNEMGLTASTVS